MTDPDGVESSRGRFSWIWRVFRPQRPPIIRPERDLSRETLRTQVDVIRRAFDGQVAVATGEKDLVEFLYRPGHVLVRSQEREEVERFFRDRQEVFDGVGTVVAEPVDGLDLYQLPVRRSDGAVEILETLEDLDREVREGIATPDHVLYVTPGGTGRMCPATEPELPPHGGTVPPMNTDLTAGKDVRVSVVDTGWYAAAETNKATLFLKGVEGDLEYVNPAAIHAYAGHGTFVAGVVRCMAPATEVEVEGFLTHGGAAYESEIVRQLNQAMTDNDDPELISISAGSHTRKGLPMLSFQALAAAFKLAEGEDAPLVVAAAGNDESSDPFWPAAFDWVLSVGSLDPDGRVSKFSNYGKWVDVYALGRNLVNAFPIGTYTTYEPQTPANQVRKFETGLAQWSGTSFATPVVTGAIAAYMSRHGVKARAARDALKAAAPTKQDPTAGTVKQLGPPFM